MDTFDNLNICASFVTPPLLCRGRLRVELAAARMTAGLVESTGKVDPARIAAETRLLDTSVYETAHG